MGAPERCAPWWGAWIGWMCQLQRLVEYVYLQQ